MSLWPQRFCERHIESFKQAVIKVGEEVFFRPLMTEGMGLGTEAGMKSILLGKSSIPRVHVGIGTTVQGAADDVVAAERVGVIITTRFGDIDLPTRRPLAVSVGYWEHP